MSAASIYLYQMTYDLCVSRTHVHNSPRQKSTPHLRYPCFREEFSLGTPAPAFLLSDPPFALLSAAFLSGGSPAGMSCSCELGLGGVHRERENENTESAVDRCSGEKHADSGNQEPRNQFLCSSSLVHCCLVTLLVLEFFDVKCTCVEVYFSSFAALSRFGRFQAPDFHYLTLAREACSGAVGPGQRRRCLSRGLFAFFCPGCSRMQQRQR